MNGVQTYRNPKLVHIFDKLEMIENFWTRIPRTIYSYEDYDIQPEFKITNNFFVVTLPNINFYNELESGQVNTKNSTDVRLNDRINVQNNADGRLNGRINSQNDADGRLNGRINAQNNADGRINDQENEQNNMDDQFNESISELGKEIFMIVMQNPGIRIPEIVIKLSEQDEIVSYSKVRNCIRRNLMDYVERRGSKKSGGYYLKNKF